MITAILSIRDMIAGLFTKPIIVAVVQTGAFSAGVASVIGWLNPILGCIAFIIFIMIQWSKYKKQKIEEKIAQYTLDDIQAKHKRKL